MRTALALALASLALAAAPASLANGCPSPCSGEVVTPDSERLLFVQPDGERGRIVAYDTRAGTRAFSLPAGLTSANGLSHVSATRTQYGTSLARFHVPTGRVVRAWFVRGRWGASGVSPNGRWLALVRRVALSTAVAVVDTWRGKVVHRRSFAGDYEVETVAANGRRLFLVEHLPQVGARRYQLRIYELPVRTLVADPLSGKGEPRVMAGYAWSGVASPDGRWLLTLYLDTVGRSAFVHALDLVRAEPRCIFLPSNAALDWLKRYSLTLSPDGRRLFAANPALGVVAEVDLAKQRVVRTARFRPAAAPVPRRLPAGTISRNGRTLYFGGGRELWAYDAAFGVVRGPYRPGGRVVGFGYGGGDRRVHVLRGDGRLVALEASTGRRLRA